MWRRLKSNGINPLNTGLDSPTAQEQNAKQPPLAGSRVVDDIRDEPGAEMAKDARVWKTYVKETDRFDQEMMNGRDSSLDVLLIFAALFSAISTTFLVESLGDLQPNTTVSSAQSLQLMSQALAAIANSQPVSLPVQITLDTSEFSPPRSAIIVNVLWVLSLSLSVAVSLFAILAKEWCYIFMSGRSGQAYEQARRRQQRWNGIRKWRMKGVLTYLPGALHMALGLFAVGMCVYLWDINTVVALPVIVVSGLAALVYICVTILPAIDPYCPYGSAAAAAPIRTVRALRVTMASLVDYFSHQINRFGCVEIIPLSATGSTFPPGDHTLDHRERDTPMDEVTSQMIAWLLTNCEDTHSVDVALQAIAGARHNLACAPLMQCGVLELLAPRLMACIQWDRHRGQYLVKDLTMLPTALTYCRAYSTLMFREAYTNIWDKARTDLPKDKRLATSTRSRGEEGRIMQVHLDLLKQAMDVSEDSNAVAAAIAAAMPFCRWNQINSPCSSQNYNIVLDHATDMLTRHLEDKCVGLSTPALYALVESTAHYTIAVWPKEKRQDSYNSLPVLLARVFFACFDTAPDVAHAAAITLAAAAFASDYYPGDNQLSQDPFTREKRAAQVLEHYYEHRPTRHKASSLFVFGFIGLLPRLNFKTLDSQAESLPGLLASAMKDMRLFNSKHYQTHIHTLSVDFTLQDHVRSTAYQFLLLVIHKSLAIDEELSVVFSWSSFLQHGSNWSRPDDRLYITALIALCHAKSHELQDLCMQIISKQPLPTGPPQHLKPIDGRDPLELLAITLLYTNTSTISNAVQQFGLLVASIISSPHHSIVYRKSTLRRILQCHHVYSDLDSSITEHHPANVEEMLMHLGRGDAEQLTPFDALLRTMVFAVNFCHAGLEVNSASVEQSPAEHPASWTGLASTSEYSGASQIWGATLAVPEFSDGPQMPRRARSRDSHRLPNALKSSLALQGHGIISPGAERPGAQAGMEVHSWHEKLQRLKDTYRLSAWQPR